MIEPLIGTAAILATIGYIATALVVASETKLGKEVDSLRRGGIALLWVVFFLVGGVAHLVTYIGTIRHQWRLERKRREARLEVEYQRALEELGGSDG